MCSKILIISLVMTTITADVSHIVPRFGGHPNSVDYDPNPQYSYSYSVNDAYTGDNHAQEESRQGDNVQGSYSLIEADGSLRTVKYAADPINGFTAVVEHSGGASRVHGAASPRLASYAPIAPVASYAPVAPFAPVARLTPVAAPTTSYVTPKLSFAPRPYAGGAGSATVHTSFSAPHATYHY